MKSCKTIENKTRSYNVWGLNINSITLFIMILAFCQDLSLGIFPLGESKTMTAEVTLTTAGGGEPNDFSSVKLAC